MSTWRWLSNEAENEEDQEQLTHSPRMFIAITVKTASEEFPAAFVSFYKQKAASQCRNQVGFKPGRVIVIAVLTTKGNEGFLS